jgi:hypothetical protein
VVFKEKRRKSIRGVSASLLSSVSFSRKYSGCQVAIICKIICKLTGFSGFLSNIIERRPAELPVDKSPKNIFDLMILTEVQRIWHGGIAQW